MSYDDLEPFCVSDWQRTVLKAYVEQGSSRKAAKELHRDRKAVDRVIGQIRLRAALSGVAPESDLNHPVPMGQSLRGVSSLYDQEGKLRLQWVKTRQEDEAAKVLLEALADALKEELPTYPPIAPPEQEVTDLMNAFVITDYHLGMVAWGEETGADWDVVLAEGLLMRWFDTAIKLAPKADLAVLAQLGDFLHWDGMEPVTPIHKNVLDVDTRFAKLVRTAIRLLRRIVDSLLCKYPKVHVVMAEGNHDMASSIWIREFLADAYHEEPRLTVDTSPSPYYCVEFGNTSLFFHHGHKRKITNVAEVFAAQFRDVFGRTRHSYAHLGHLHNEAAMETALMLVERHRTLASPDAHAHRGGWHSGRDAKVYTYHREFGRVGQIVVSPEMCGVKQ